MTTFSKAQFVAFLALFVITASANAEDKQETEYTFKVETAKPQPAMTVRFQVKDAKLISENYATSFTKLFGYVAANGGEISGMPFGRYHSATEEGLDIEAGLPVAKKLDPKDDIKAIDLPGGRVVTTVHTGPYEELSKAHKAMQKHIADKGYKVDGPLWEQYLTDPGEEPDSSKWQTKLYQPIAEKE